MLTRAAARVVLTAAMAAAGLAVAGPGWADGGITPVDCASSPRPECTVSVGTPGESGSPGSPDGAGGVDGCRDANGEVVPCYIEGRGWRGTDGCYYQPLEGAAPAPPEATGSGSWYRRSCVPGRQFGRGLPLFGTVEWIPDSALPIDPAVLARQAVARLRLGVPVIRVNPAVPAPQVVFVPTWLWLDPATWGRRSATASVPGMSVTATATPTQVVWSTGDGGTVTCAGPGTPWRAGGDPRAGSPTCGHTYRRPSTGAPGGVYPVRATVVWQVTWTGGGTSGAVPPLTTSASVSLRVVESQSINGTGR